MFHVSHKISITFNLKQKIQKADDTNRWAELVRRRSMRLADLRREFQGWHGAHERHCILHDVLLA